MSVDTEKEDVVDHEKYFFQNYKAIFEQPELSDVTLVVEECHFPAHKVILAAQSDYFKSLLFGGLKESSQKEIVLKDPKNAKSFKVLLEYLYTARMDLRVVEMGVLLDVLELSQKWNIQKLTHEICGFMESNLAVDYLWDVYNVAVTYGFSKLSKECLVFADCNAIQVLQHESFLHLSSTVMKELISHDTFCAPEEVIFDRICAWIPKQKELQSSVELVLKQVRWPLIPLPDFLRISKSLTSENNKAINGMILDTYNPQHSKAQSRGYGIPGVNVATAERGAKVVEPSGASQKALDSKSTDSYTAHVISVKGDQAIVIELDREYLLNFIKVKLLYKDINFWNYYSYQIEVSDDQISWVKIADYKDFCCFHCQNIYFAHRLVKYIKIIGTKIHLSREKELKVVSLEAYFVRNIPEYYDTETGFFVSEGSKLEPFWYRNCDVQHDDTCKHAEAHSIHWRVKENAILLFTQPLKTSFVQILLFDPISSGGDYRVQVSKDEATWKEIGTVKSFSSWQILKFDLAPLTRLRIIRPEGVETVPLCLEVNCLPITKDISDAKK